MAGAGCGGPASRFLGRAMRDKAGRPVHPRHWREATPRRSEVRWLLVPMHLKVIPTTLERGRNLVRLSGSRTQRSTPCTAPKVQLLRERPSCGIIPYLTPVKRWRQVAPHLPVLEFEMVCEVNQPVKDRFGIDRRSFLPRPPRAVPPRATARRCWSTCAYGGHRPPHASRAAPRPRADAVPSCPARGDRPS